MRFLSVCFPAVHEGIDPAQLRLSAVNWMLWERKCNPRKDVMLVQVLDITGEQVVLPDELAPDACAPEEAPAGDKPSAPA